jgi:hypothetical protein
MRARLNSSPSSARFMFPIHSIKGQMALNAVYAEH